MGTEKLIEAIDTHLTQRGRKPAADPAPLKEWLRSAGNEELYRINAYQLADRLEVGRAELLSFFIDLVVDGVFELNWDFHCPYCNGINRSHHHLKEAVSTSHCTVCTIHTPFNNELDGNTEVTFTPSPAYYRIPEAFVRKKTDEMVAQIQATNYVEMPEVYVKGIDCLHIPAFREHFGDDVLAKKESLHIRRVCIMFTDIKGSTALYEEYGDARAYALVREHFEIMFGLVEKCGGVVVKTIGDAVMASFVRPEDALHASLMIEESFEAFNQREDVRGQIELKIGLHAGSTLLVNLNDRDDYFGQTVNVASRVQGAAQGREIVVSEAVLRDPEARDYLRNHIVSLTRRKTRLKGLHGTYRIYRLNTGSGQASGQPARLSTVEPQAATPAT